MQSLVGETEITTVRNGNLLATKRHQSPQKFESSIQQIIQFVSFVSFVIFYGYAFGRCPHAFPSSLATSRLLKGQPVKPKPKCGGAP